MNSKSKEFDNILDECLERLLGKGETVEQCLQSFPEHVDVLKPLLEMVPTIKKASAIQPSTDFRARARYEFYSALQEVERKRSRPFFAWQPRWATVVAVILAILLAGSSTVAAASGSMPDELLYPVKLATEQVQLVLTPSALGKAELYAKLADKRVLEIVSMAGENKPGQLELTARRLDAYLTKMADLVLTQEVTASVAMAPAVEEVPTPRPAPEAEKAPAAREVPPDEETLVGKGAPAAEEVPVVQEVPLLPNQVKAAKGARVRIERRAKLQATVIHNATSNPARLHAILETVPESAKPALLRAIAVSEAGYKKVLESLD
ncbi:DUF5667 domain-containing protein [Chloroflexota bacterium]